MEFANLNKALVAYGEDAVRFAKLELGTEKMRPSRRTKWKKNGREWKPLATRVVMKRRRAVSSGRLQNSLGYTIKENQQSAFIRFKGALHGVYVENGRKPGKGVPPEALSRWVNTKGLRPRGKNNQFVKATESRKKGVGFVINRSIKHFGIEPNPFMKPAEERALDIHINKIETAFAKDIADDLETSL